jgi:hypothetical protein
MEFVAWAFHPDTTRTGDTPKANGVGSQIQRRSPKVRFFLRPKVIPASFWFPRN